MAQFYGNDFIPCNPPDMKTLLVSRTVGDQQLVDEIIVSFTHTQEVTWMLPGIPATGLPVRVPLVVIVGFADGRMSSEHIYWDNASVLLQVGLIKQTPGIQRCINGSVTADCVLHSASSLLSSISS